MANNSSAIGNVGGASSASNMGSRGGNSVNSNGGNRFNSYTDMGSQDEFDVPVMAGGQQHQMAYPSMSQMTSGGNNGYGNGAVFMGSGGSYSTMSTTHGGSNNLRRSATMRQQGIDSHHQGMGDMQHMSPLNQQQLMNDMYMPQGPMQDMVPQHQHHSQYNMYGSRPSSGGSAGSLPMNQQYQHSLQDDYTGSGSSNVMQQQQRQQQRRPVPSLSPA